MVHAFAVICLMLVAICLQFKWGVPFLPSPGRRGKPKNSARGLVSAVNSPAGSGMARLPNDAFDSVVIKTIKTKTKTTKTKTIKTKTKTWPLRTKLTQRLKDRDTNTIIPNLYPVTKMHNMLVKYSA